MPPTLDVAIGDSPLANAIDKKYTDYPDLVGYDLAATYVMEGKDAQGNLHDYPVLIFQKL